MTDQPILISLPTGTEKRGLHLTPPHGHLIWDGRKTAIAKAKPFDLSGPWILVSGGKAYGTIEVGQPEVVTAQDFDTRFHKHRVTRAERQKWWSEASELYLSKVLRFDQFDEALEIQVVPGMQTVVEEVCFVGDEPAGLAEYCKGVSERLSIIGEFMEEMPTEIVEEQVVDNVKEKEPMPYSIDKPPDRIAGLPAAAKRIWISAYNAAHSKYDGDEERSNKIAWGAVKNAGYSKDEDGNWRKAEKVLPEAEEELLDALSAHEGIAAHAAGETVPWEEAKERLQVAADEPDTPCDEATCQRCNMNKAIPVSEEGGNRLKAWLKKQFDGVLDNLRGGYIEGEAVDAVVAGFKTFTAKDGRQWLLTWTTNAFEDREEEIFRTKAIEEYVVRHEGDDKKGEIWFWHMPGAKFADIHWQATVGRFLVEAGPFDDTPIGSKFAAFFADYPHDHPVLAPEGWGTSHGYHYLSGDRKDAVYDWFDKFETTVLPKSAAANQHSPRMEVLPMNQQQQEALTAIGGADFVKMVETIGEEHTKELEGQGVAFKAAEAEVVEEQPEVEEQKALPQEEAVQEVEDGGSEDAEASVDSKAKGTEEIVQQIVAGLNLGDLLAAVKQQTDGIAAMSEKVNGIEGRLKTLENLGVDQDAPLAAMWPTTAMRASKAAQTVTEDAVKEHQPHMPTAISGMAQHIPV